MMTPNERAQARAEVLEELADEYAGTLHTRIIDSFIATLRSRAAIERILANRETQ